MIDRVFPKRIARAALASVVLVIVLAGLRLHAAADVIVACASSSGLRIVGSAGECRKDETPLTWNAQGQAGPQGIAGPAGPEGPAGRDGRDGRDGNNTPPPTVTAQMRIDGVNNGAATPIAAFSLGATDTISTSTGSGGGAGKVTFSNLVVSKTLDGASVPLLHAASTGQVLHTVSIDVFNAGSATPFATYTFQDVIVTSVVFGSATSLVGEQDAFDFGKITADVTINGQTFHSCFDVRNLTSCS